MGNVISLNGMTFNLTTTMVEGNYKSRILNVKNIFSKCIERKFSNLLGKESNLLG